MQLFGITAKDIKKIKKNFKTKKKIRRTIGCFWFISTYVNGLYGGKTFDRKKNFHLLILLRKKENGKQILKKPKPEIVFRFLIKIHYWNCAISIFQFTHVLIFRYMKSIFPFISIRQLITKKKTSKSWLKKLSKT